MTLATTHTIDWTADVITIKLIEAIEAFCRCLRLRPKHYASLVTLATVLAAGGRFEEALEQIDAAIEVRPRLTRAQNVRRDILQKTVRVEAADDLVVAEDL